MKTTRGVFILSVIGLIISSPCQAQEWAYLYDQPIMGHNIRQTLSGDYLLFGGSKILTINPNGTVAGNAYFADAYGLQINSTNQTPDEGFVFAGYIRGYEVDPWGYNGLAVFKTNPDGTIAWANKYHCGQSLVDPHVCCIKSTSDGGYIVGGAKDFISTSHRQSCLLKLDATGAVEWYREMNDDARRSCVKALQETTDNGFIVAGFFDWDDTARGAWLAKLDATGNFVWEKVFDGSIFYSVAQTLDGGYVAAGQGCYPNRGYQVLKVDSFGDLEWHRAYDTSYLSIDEGTGNEYYFQRDGYATAIQETNDNGYVVVGYRGSQSGFKADVMMLKLDTLGNLEWNRIFKGPHTAKAYSVLQTTDYGYLLVGKRETASSPITSTAWLIKTDENGDLPTYGNMAVAEVTVTPLENEGENVTGNWSNSSSPYRVEIDVTREADVTVTRSDGSPYQPTVCRIKPGKNETNPFEPGTILKIIGSGFGDMQSVSEVHIGPKTYGPGHRKIKDWSDTRIRIKLPNYKCEWFKGLDYRSRKIWITVDGVDSNTKRTKVFRPNGC